MKQQTMILMFCWMGISVTSASLAQKPHKYTTKNKSESSVFDSLMKQCFKNNVLRCDSCDTLAVRGYLVDQINKTSTNKKSYARICSFMNIYHSWLILSLCASNGLKRLSNDSTFLTRDTLLLQQSGFTLTGMRSSILEMAQKDKISIWCSLWNGTVSGAPHPKKEFQPESFASTIKAKAKAYFKTSPDEYSLDRSKHIITVSERMIQELGLFSSGKSEASLALELILPHIPESDAAFYMINKSLVSIRSIAVSDRISMK
jgi:hypothetical protein